MRQHRQQDRRSILDWLADASYQGEAMTGFYDDYSLSAHFPEREDLNNPGQRINADLIVHRSPKWPNLDRPIAKPSAERIIYAMAIADSLHEIVESIRIDGERPLNPHPVPAVTEDENWDTILDIAVDAAIRLVKEHKRA